LKGSDRADTTLTIEAEICDRPRAEQHHTGPASAFEHEPRRGTQAKRKRPDVRIRSQLLGALDEWGRGTGRCRRSPAVPLILRRKPAGSQHDDETSGNTIRASSPCSRGSVRSQKGFRMRGLEMVVACSGSAWRFKPRLSQKSLFTASFRNIPRPSGFEFRDSPLCTRAIPPCVHCHAIGTSSACGSDLGTSTLASACFCREAVRNRMRMIAWSGQAI